MKERPILFSAPMVRALLDASKAQTRRVCKPAAALSAVVEVADPLERGQVYNGSPFSDEEGNVQFASPYGGIGDRLWVREAHALSAFDPERLSPHDDPGNYDVIYRADPDQPSGGWRDAEGKVIKAPWRPSIHMPRWASRITLEVTLVRVERLQDISRGHAMAEGVETWRAGWDQKTAATMFLHGTKARVETNDGPVAKRLYMLLWEAINGAGSWAANPWVWVVEFRRIKP